jgi:hypothetical protein
VSLKFHFLTVEYTKGGKRKSKGKDHFYSPHFTEEETEDQRGKAIC